MAPNEARAALLRGPAHPLGVLALAGLVGNDVWGKAAYPGWFTGKLSDACWLAVAPLVLAALLARLPLSPALARRLAIVTTGAAYTLLQLWPPLGDLWSGLLGGAHVADAADLLMLPALALAPLAWRPHRWRVPGILPLSALACVATSWIDDWDQRYPCDDQAGWDPDVPLLLHWEHDYTFFDPGHDEFIPEGSYNLVRGVRLEEEGGAEVPLILLVDDRDLLICAQGGLKPNQAYRWTVRFDNSTPNHRPVRPFELEGTWSFATGERVGDDLDTEEDCRRFLEMDRALGDDSYSYDSSSEESPYNEAPCACEQRAASYGDTSYYDDCEDTGDSGDSGDSGGER